MTGIDRTPAFVFVCRDFWLCQGNNTIGFTVLGGMIASTSISIFIVPVLFVLFTKFSYGKKQLAYLQAHHEELMEKEKKVEDQNLDPELEYEIEQAKAKANPDQKS